MKQELLLKSETPHLDSAVEKTVRTLVYVAAVIFWLHEKFSPRDAGSRNR